MNCRDCIHCKVCKHYEHFEDCEDYQKNCFYKNDTELGGVKEIPFRKATEIVSEKLCQFVSEEKKK